MVISRELVSSLAVLLLSSATPVLGSEITVEWSGVFNIPDIVDPPGVFIDLTVSPDPAGMNIIEDLDVGLIIPTTWQGDLIISLEHVESGRFHRLLDRPGSPEVNLKVSRFRIQSVAHTTPVPSGPRL